MEVWIVEGGEKRGPFQTYEMRDRIEREELSGEELAWHKDQDDWVPLKELDVFRSAFETARPEPATPPPLPTKPQPFLRFWARWFDVLLYLLAVFGTLRLFGQDIAAALLSPTFQFLYFFPFLILEALAIHLYKTTPGKFLLGIRVVTAEDGALPLGTSLMRSLRVFILGLGILFWILPVICQALCLWFTLKNGKAPWDVVAGTKVRVVGPLVLPVMAFMLGFATILGLLGVILVPPVEEVNEILRERAGTT